MEQPDLLFNKEFKKENVVSICQNILRVQTVNPPGDERALATYCHSLLSQLGLSSQLIEHSETRASVLACLKGNGSVPGVMICSHMDTVPVGAAPWKHPPFSGELVEDKIWGRGASDMKGGLAASLAAVQVLVESGYPLQGDLWIALTAGEETDFLGALEIANHREVLPLQVIILPEPSSNEVYLAQKGALWLDVEMYGKTAHGSMPDLGVNAVESMAQFVHCFKDIQFAYQPHPLLGGFTASVTRLNGGIKVNVIPDECHLSMDIRTVPGQSHAAILDEVNTNLHSLEEKIPGLKTEVKVIKDHPAVVTEMEDPVVGIFLDVTKEVLGEESRIKGVRYFTDSAILTPAWNVPMIICGPGHADLAHQPDEYVEISHLRQAVKIYALAVARYLAL